MWVIAYIHDEAPRGWYVIDMERWNKAFPSTLSGPHDSHADAEEAIKTRSHRLAQGWQP